MKYVLLGRHGETNGRSKLGPDDVLYILRAVSARDALRREARRLQAEARALAEQAKKKEDAAGLLSNLRLAKRLGVSEGAVRGVIYRNTWKHVR